MIKLLKILLSIKKYKKTDIIIKDIIMNQKNIKMFISVQDYLNVKVKFAKKIENHIVNSTYYK